MVNRNFDPLHSQLTYQVSQQIKLTPTPSTQPPQILDFWRDSAWQSIGVIVAVLAIVISLKQFQRKQLSYEVISNENIVKITDDSIEDELQILYKGLIKDLYLITIEFYNSGNIEIRPDDYTKHISLSFGKS